jgi:hypothetical protein
MFGLMLSPGLRTKPRIVELTSHIQFPKLNCQIALGPLVQILVSRERQPLIIRQFGCLVKPVIRLLVQTTSDELWLEAG